MANSILSSLNEEQRRAVTHDDGPLLIIAGAGTGKTTVITRRIAYLIEQQRARSEQILALTFTEKAAGEMEERVAELLPIGYFDLWISTFHAFGERILKDHSLDIGLSNNFRLLTEPEQWSLVREHLDDFDLEYYRPKGNPTKFIQALITHFSRLKDEDITPQEYGAYAATLMADEDAVQDEKISLSQEAQRVREVASAYQKYQQLLVQAGAMDFGDLIVNTIKLLRQRPAILEKLRQQFSFILVDEFQDTNYAQYDLVKLLALPRNNLTVVGDDDQSIYAWRGASMSSILNFKKDFPHAHDVTLSHNYRSPQNILNLAYDFIQKNNPNRLEETLNIQKRLQSQHAHDGIIAHLHAKTLSEEAILVAEKMMKLKEADASLAWNDIALLVRANDHAEAFLPVLDRMQIPYQFLASRGLFSKPIVLDVFALLRLLDNYHESRAMVRVLHFPIWKLAPEDIMVLMNMRAKKNQSLYETCRDVRAIPNLASATYDAVEKIIVLIEKFTHEAQRRNVGEVVLKLLETSGYLQCITQANDATASEHVLYLNQFFKYIEAFERAHLEKNVHDFLAEMMMMIESGEAGRLQPDFEDGPEAVKIMTVHAAKGLEFTYVFVVNLVDQRFPSIGRKEAISIPEAIVKDILPAGDAHIEEERRIFYVALTRAKRGVFLTSAEDYGGARKKKPSRFLIETGFANPVAQATGRVLFGDRGAERALLARVVKKHLPNLFSYTQLKAYEACPWQYRFAFLLNVPVPGRASLSFGKTIHASLYEFFRRMKEGNAAAQQGLFAQSASVDRTPTAPSLQELLQIYEQQWIDEWYTSRRNRDEYFANGKRALEKFYELHTEHWPNVKLLEEGFNIRLNDYRLKGAMDRVDETPAGLAIIDYKTGKFPKSGKRDVEQLYIYALALREVFAEDPAELSYYFVEDNKAITEEFNLQKLEEVRAWVLELIAKILEGNFKATPGFHCKVCDYRDICEFRAL